MYCVLVVPLYNKPSISASEDSTKHRLKIFCKNSINSKEQNLNLLHISNYLHCIYNSLHRIYPVLGIISNLVRACSVTQLCHTLSDPMDCSPPGSSVHGILQAKILEWVVIFSSRGSSQPRELIHVSSMGRHILTPLSHLGTS